ncbi:MAG: hypothetical protein J3Q66DRAFT_96316 [Benniella sp.]|nr:MAG: hypothetical protein J3Q66DRAFT_96316 [Benniella sp.]
MVHLGFFFFFFLPFFFLRTVIQEESGETWLELGTGTGFGKEIRTGELETHAGDLIQLSNLQNDRPFNATSECFWKYHITLAAGDFAPLREDVALGWKHGPSNG